MEASPKEVYQPKSTLVFLALSQHSTDQRYAPFRCFNIVTCALSLYRYKKRVNKPNLYLSAFYYTLDAEVVVES